MDEMRMQEIPRDVLRDANKNAFLEESTRHYACRYNLA